MIFGSRPSSPSRLDALQYHASKRCGGGAIALIFNFVAPKVGGIEIETQ